MSCIKIINRDFLILTTQFRTINQQGHTDGDASEYGNGSFPVLGFLFQFFQPFPLFLRKFLLELLLQLFLFLVLLIVQSLTVDVHLIGLGHGLGLADNLFQIIELLQLQIIQLHQLIVIQAVVLKPVTDDTFHIYPFQLFQHVRYVKTTHLRSFNGYDRAKINELTHGLTVTL